MERRPATDVFHDWAVRGKDEGMERGHALSVAEMVDFILETEKGKQHKADSRVGTGIFLGYIWRSTEYLVGTADGIFQCRTVRRGTEKEAYDPKFVETLKIKYDDYILKGAKSSQTVTMLAVTIVHSWVLSKQQSAHVPVGLFVRVRFIDLAI